MNIFQRSRNSLRLRPLFLLADLESGGAQRVILNVLRRLDRERFEPHLGIVNMTGPMIGEIPRDAVVHDIGHDIGAGRVRYAVPGLIRLCRTLNPPVLLSTLGHLNIAVLAVRFAFPCKTGIVVREANLPSIRLKYTRYPWIYRALYRLLYPGADAIICNSDYMKEDLARTLRVPAGKVFVIPNPVDRERIARLLRGSRSPYSRGKYNFVTVGRFHYQKGFDMLLQAFRFTRRRVPGVHLTLVGEGEDEGLLRKIVTDGGMDHAVTFAGPQPNPFPFMAYSDLFISSSRWEGSPNAVLESLACGTPVLAFDCPGGTKEIIKEELNGWLVPARNVEALGMKMVELCEREAWKRMRGYDLLPEAYRSGDVCRRYEELFQRVARGDL
ncbi:MAG: glycosyltransferase [Deltaproteobacteria bacterium]|nr:glycosyltransferase [Deltaproteobacteria bacterium]